MALSFGSSFPIWETLRCVEGSGNIFVAWKCRYCRSRKNIVAMVLVLNATRVIDCVAMDESERYGGGIKNREGGRNAGGRLTEQEHRQIAAGLADDLAYAEIAGRLERPSPTITGAAGRAGTDRLGAASRDQHDGSRGGPATRSAHIWTP
ncbi:hypothetical protein AB0M58_29910 [Streptomyces bobili]